MPSAEHTNGIRHVAVVGAGTVGSCCAWHLRRAGFDTRSDYMEWFGGHQDFPEGVIYLPNHPAMNAHDVDRLVQAVRTATRGMSATRAPQG